MRQILIYDTQIEDYLELKEKLEEKLSVEITHAFDFDSAKSLVHILPELDFIIINSNRIEFEKIHKLETFLIEEKNNTTIYLFGEENSDFREETIKLDCDLSSIEFENIIKEKFLTNETEKTLKLKPLFVPVELHFIKQNLKQTYPIDFYIRIKRSAEDFQYIKRFPLGELIDEQDLIKIEKHNVTQLYILKSDYKSFIDFSLKINLNNKPSNIQEKDYHFFLAKEVISLIGIDENTEAIVKNNIEHMENVVSKNESLVNFLNHLKKSPNSYCYVHSNLLALILSKIVTQFEWDSKLIKDKVCFAAFFHDITLLDDKLAKIQTHEELYRIKTVDYEFQSDSTIREKKYKDFEIEQVQYHALNAALLLEKLPGIPPGVNLIVKEHHGAKNGIGIIEQQSISLQPLSMIFIVIEDFVSEFLALENVNKVDLKKITTKLEQKYTKTTYKKAVMALLKIVS